MRSSTSFLIRVLTVVSIILVVLSAFSCSREEPQDEAASSAVNPYSTETVYSEVQRQLRENPDDPDALMHMADLYDRNAQYPEAIEAYKKVVAVKPDMGYAYFKMGTAYSRINKPEEAIEAFKEATKYLPGYAAIYNNMGVAYGKIGKLDEEIAALKKAIELRPNYASARYNLGMTYKKKGDDKAAMREYEDLRKYDEGMADLLLKELNSSS